MTKAEQQRLERIARRGVRELAQHIPFHRDATTAQIVKTFRAMQAELETGISILKAVA
jgi:hypothetical protein